jgi:hypothetical protein
LAANNPSIEEAGGPRKRSDWALHPGTQKATSTMSILNTPAFRAYGLALCGNFLGAWLLDVTGSMLPLAFSASASLLCTEHLVKTIRSAKTTARGNRR